MNPLTSQPAPDWSVEQLRQHFGMIAGDRILLDPAPGTATEQDILRLDSSRGYPPELLDGVCIDRMSGFYGAIVATELLFRLMDYRRTHNLGIVISGAKCPIRLQPGLVRLGSVFFISWDQMPGHKIPDDPISDMVPELVGEMLSPWTTRVEMHRKRREFFAAGTKLFWLLDLEKETIEVFTPQHHRRLQSGDTLDAGDLLPGFRVPVAEVFEYPQRPENP